MRKQMIENAAYEVATQVRAVEDVIDAALAEIAELQARLLRVNAIAHTSIATAHPAIEQIAASFQSLVAARGGMARCHAELVSAKQLVPGLRTVSFGESEECPPAQAKADLRIVA